MSRWQLLEETSPSGKTLFCCSICGRTSATPDKRCQGRNCEQIERCQTPRRDYLAAMDSAERRMERGEQQVLCRVCQRWQWPDEQCLLALMEQESE